MPSPSTLAAFSVTALLFVLFPGPAMLFLVARGVAGGPRAGALSALGVEAANAVYVVATALGLTAVLAASSTAFAVVRYAGAAYLVYLGVRTLRERADAQAPVLAAGSVTAWTSWRQGFLVGIGNPKAALFFLAFFPQFIHPEAGAAWTQVLVLGAVIIAIGTVLDVSYGVFGGLVRSRLARRSARGVRRGRIAVGPDLHRPRRAHRGHRTPARLRPPSARTGRWPARPRTTSANRSTRSGTSRRNRSGSMTSSSMRTGAPSQSTRSTRA